MCAIERRTTVSAGPCLDDVDVVWRCAVYGGDACSPISRSAFSTAWRADTRAPLYVVPKSTPTISLSCAELTFAALPAVAGAGLWFAPGLKAIGMLPTLPPNGPVMLGFLSILFPSCC